MMRLATFAFLLALLASTAAVLLGWQHELSWLFLPTKELLKRPLPLSDFAQALSLAPTMATAFLAGGLLGLSSHLLQLLAKNPLASDSTLAVGSGAQMALLLATIFFQGLGAYGSFWVGFLGACASMGLVFLLSLPSRLNPVVVVLSGLVVNILLAAIATLILLFFDQYTLGVMVWGSGVLTQMGWAVPIQLFWGAIILGILLIPLYKSLVVMLLDERQAKSLGVPVAWLRLSMTALVAAVLSLVVGHIGLVGFVGLGAATLSGFFGFAKLWQRLLASFLCGGAILLLTSNIVVLFFDHMTVGAGSLSAILGAPLVVYLALKLPKQMNETLVLQAPTQRKFRPWWAAALLAVLIFLALSFAPKVVGAGLDMSVTWAFLDTNSTEILWSHRLPRTLTAISAGMILSVAGVVLQSLTKNPMASPEVLGISSATALGVIVGFFILPLFGLQPALGFLLGFGLVGAALALILLLWLAKKMASSQLLLVGIALSSLLAGVMSFVKASGDPRLTGVLSFLAGSTYYANKAAALFYFAVACVGVMLACMLAKPLAVMGFGDVIAQGRGILVAKLRFWLLFFVGILSVVATFATGPLSFVGLMIPHVAFMLGARTLQSRILASALLGAMLLLVADWVGRYLLFPYEIPAGGIASLVGGLYFVGLMRSLKH